MALELRQEIDDDLELDCRAPRVCPVYEWGEIPGTSVERMYSLHTAPLITTNAIMMLFPRNAASEKPRKNGDQKSHAPRGTINAGTNPFPHSLATAKNTTATPTAILLHMAAVFRLKPSTNGDTPTHSPKRIFTQPAPADVRLFVAVSFIIHYRSLTLTWPSRLDLQGESNRGSLK